MGMSNAYKIADEMLKDKIGENKYNEIKNSDVIVIPGQYDHIQNVFSDIGVNFSIVDSQNFSQIKLNPDQIIFINCAGHIDQLGLRKLNTFVNEGGFLFTTDWALSNIIENVFPGFIKYNKRPTADEVVRVEILAKEDPFLKSLISEHEEPLWWLEGSSYPISIINKDKVKVLVQSKELEQKYGESPVFVSFNYGKGTIYHMISHFYLQRSETRNLRDNYSGEEYIKSKLQNSNYNSPKYASMIESDTIYSEVESAFSSSALMNKVLWDKKNQKKGIVNE